MAQWDDLLSAAISNPTVSLRESMPLTVPQLRQQEVAAASSEKMAALGNHPAPDIYRRAAIARITGSGVNSSTGIERDLSTLPYDAFRSKYGEDVGNGYIRGLTSAMSQYRNERSGQRSVGDTVYDTTTGVGLGLANSVLGIGALGLGMVNDRAGLFAAEKLQQMNEWAQGTQSPALRARRQANQERTALDERDNEALFQEESQKDGSFVAGLRRFARDGWDSVANIAQDPTLLVDGVAQGVGSILAAGPTAKALGAVGKLTLGRELSKTASTSLAIGAMESAGVYGQTASGLANLSHEQLLERSPRYRELIAQDVDPAEAKADVINRTALLSAAITAPVAVAAGRLVSGFESAPFRVPTLRQAISNPIREMVEEGIQGGSGKLAENFSVQNIADDSRTLSQGVGEAAGTGALFGLGAAGALQAPGLAGRAARAAGSAAGTAAMAGLGAIGDGLQSRADNLRAANEAASPGSAQNLQQAQERAAAQAPAAQQTLNDAIAASNASPEAKAAASEAVTRLVNINTLDEGFVSDPSVPESIRQTLTGSTTSIDAMRRLSAMVQDTKNVPEQDRQMAALALLNMRASFDGAVKGDLSVLEDLEDGTPAKDIFKEYQQLSVNLRDSPVLNQAFQRAEQFLKDAAEKGRLPEVNEEVLSSENGQQVANLRTAAAIAAPALSDPAINEMMLAHASSGKIRMTVAQFQSLQAVNEILTATKAAQEAQAALGHKNLINDVTKQVLTNGESEGSAMSYATRIFNAMLAQNPKEARQELAKLGRLVKHFSNKLEATNASIYDPDGKVQPFQAHSVKTPGQWYTANSKEVHLRNANSIELAQQTELEGKRLAEIYNGLSKAFPVLQGGQMTMPSLPTELQGKPVEVAKAFADGRPRPTKNVALVPAGSNAVAPTSTTTPVVTQNTTTGDQQTTQVETAVQAAPPAPPKSETRPGKRVIITGGLKYNDRDAVFAALDQMQAKDGISVIMHQGARGADSLASEWAKKNGVSEVIVKPDWNKYGRSDKAWQEANQNLIDKHSPDAVVMFPGDRGTADMALRSRKAGLPVWEPPVKKKNETAATPRGTDPGASQGQAETGAADTETKGKSAYTQEQARKLTDAALNERLNQLIDLDSKRTADEQATFEALDEEMSRRESEAADMAQRETKDEEASTQADKNEEIKQISEQKKLAAPAEETKTNQPKGLRAAFANLLKSSRFFDAFKIPAEPRSRLLFREDMDQTPLRALFEAFRDSVAMTEFTKGAFGPDTNKDTYDAYREYLREGRQMQRQLEKSLQTFLNTVNGKTGLSNLQAIEAGQPVESWVNGKPISIVEKVDGKYRYNADLLETAVLAALQWRLTLPDMEKTLTEDMLRDDLKLPVDEMPELIAMADGKYTLVQLKRSLANKIQEYWGLNPNRDAPMGYTDGIAEAMAAEIIEVLTGPLSNDKLPFFDAWNYAIPQEYQVEGSPKRVEMFGISKPLDLKDPLRLDLTALDKASLLKPEPIYHLGKPPEKQESQQHRQPAIANSAEAKAATKTASETPYRLDVRWFNAMDAIGIRNWLEMFGAGFLDNKRWNKRHRMTLDGQNRTISSAVNALYDLVNQLQIKAKELNTTEEQVDIFYAHNMNRVGRMMMLAAQNPQSSKDIREAVTSITSTLDLSNQNTQDYTRFMVGIAQALGLPIHKQAWETSIATVEKLIHGNEADKRYQGPLAPVLDELDYILTNGDTQPAFAKKIKDAFAAANKAVGGMRQNIQGMSGDSKVKLSRMALKALFEYARYRDASPKTQGSFETSVYVEADGLANGISNAMMLTSTGPVTGTWIQRVMSGGLFFKGYNSLNEYYAQGAKDIYQVAMDIFATKLVDRLSKVISRSRQHAGMMRDILNEFLPNFSINQDGELELDRGLTKNPLTIALYGAGLTGQAGKIADAILQNMYARMSQAAQAQANNPRLSMAEAMYGGPNISREQAEAKYAAFEQAMNQLTSQVAVTGKKGWVFTTQGLTPNAINFNPIEFDIRGNNLKNFVTNIETFFIEPMVEAIEETVGKPVMDSAKLIKNATHIQSVFQQHMFNQEVNALLEEKGKTNPQIKNEGLSRNELDQILKKVLRRYPPITAQDQTFLPAGSQTSDVNNTSYSRSLAGKYRTPGFVPGLQGAGVAGIPYMIIGTGDGYMIQRLASAKDAPKNALYIYDGVNFSLDSFEENSVKANKAVFDSWQGNPLKAVFEAYARSQDGFDLSALPKDLYESIVRTLELRKDTPLEEVQAEMASLVQELEQGSVAVDALHRAIARVSHKIDQMASARSPYVHEGLELKGETAAEMAAELESLRQEELAKIEKERRKPEGYYRGGPALDPNQATANSSAPAAPTENLPGVVDPETKVRILKPTSLTELVKQIGLTTTMQSLFDLMRLNRVVAGYTVIMGSAEQIMTYARNKGLTPPTLVRPDGKQTNGSIRFGDKTIYVVRPTREVLMHELTHASTFEVVAAVMEELSQTGRTEPSRLEKIIGLEHPERAQEVRQAVDRIQKLMDQFLSLDPKDMDPETRKAYFDATSAIGSEMRNLDNPIYLRQAAALNEFMAWGLTNRKLGEAASETSKGGLLAQTKAKLGAIAKEVVARIKELFFGKRAMPKAADDMLSQLMFNTGILIRSQPSLFAQHKDVELFMSSSYGNSENLAQLNTFLNDRVTKYLQTDPVDYNVENPEMPLTTRTGKRVLGIVKRIGKHAKAQIQADELVTRAVALGFAQTPQAQTTLRAVVAAMATQASLDPNSLAAASKLYSHVLSKLQPQDFGLDSVSMAKFRLIVGQDMIRKDGSDRSSLLPMFLGLALVDEDFQQILSKIPMPESLKKPGATVDTWLQNLGTQAMDAMSNWLSGTSRSQNVQEAIDALAEQMQKVAQQRQSIIEQLSNKAGTVTDGMNSYVLKAFDHITDKSLAAADRIEAKNPNSLTRKATAGTVRTLTALINEQRADVVSQGIITAINNVDGFRPIKRIFADLVGRTSSNAGLIDLIKKFRADSDQDRQEFREVLPSKIQEKFSRKLNDAEWSAMFRALAKTDLAALLNTFTWKDALKLFGNSQEVSRKIAELETALRTEDTAHWPQIERKAKQLANYMNTGEYGSFLLRNATSIARLNGMQVQRNRKLPNQAFIDKLDELITLYAIQGLSQIDKDVLSSLVQEEAQGTEFVLAYLQGQRKDEKSKVGGNRARENHYKGHTPSVSQDGASLIVEKDSRAAELLERSYVRVGDYKGSGAQGAFSSEGYYFSPVSDKAIFSQGLARTVRQTGYGVDIHTGFSIGLSAGQITDPQEVADITARLGREGTNTTENLLPIFNEVRQVIAYERAIDPAQLKRLNQDTNLARMLGVWRGRQVEEAKANEFNQVLIDELKRMYTEDIRLKPSNRSQYIDIRDWDQIKKDPVLVDALSIVPRDVWQSAMSAFGSDEILVRKDMLTDVFGERKATIRDAWTGTTRWDPRIQKFVRNLAVATMGNEAFRYLINTENEIQALVKSAKQLIIVKSVVVPAANFMGNIYHLVARGVPLSTIIRVMPKVLAEVHEYNKGRLQEIELDAQLRAATNNPIEERKLRARIQTIRDNVKRMSIAPLIAAGEFSAISDAGISRDELLMSGGKLHAFIEKQVDKLPEAVQRAGKYAFITKDTALFQGLQLAVQYGDFLAKAVLYQDLTQRQKRSSEYALGRITEEFVNYERLSGRFRGYLEDMGLLWFYNFKIRSVKVAASIIRNNPVHALMMGMLPDIKGVDTVLGDNLVVKGVTGGLPHSMGPSMGFSAPLLHPIANAIH